MLADLIMRLFIQLRIANKGTLTATNETVGLVAQSVLDDRLVSLAHKRLRSLRVLSLVIRLALLGLPNDLVFTRRAEDRLGDLAMSNDAANFGVMLVGVSKALVVVESSLLPWSQRP